MYIVDNLQAEIKELERVIEELKRENQMLKNDLTGLVDHIKRDFLSECG